MHKVIIDTNVFISGILFGGNPKKILKTWLAKKIIFCLSPELKAEIIGKLERKFSLQQESLLFLEKTLDTYSKKYIPKQKIKICKDPQDNFLLELAEECNANYIISGDKFVLELKKYKNTHIISPKEFLEIIAD